jgi:hypothetical protein
LEMPLVCEAGLLEVVPLPVYADRPRRAGRVDSGEPAAW